MNKLVFEKKLAVDQQEIWDWHDRPDAFLRMVPPWEKVQKIKMQRGVGGQVHLKVKIGPFWRDWFGLYAAWDQPNKFVDICQKGPFAYWRHTHEFIENKEGAILKDSIEYSLPFHSLSHFVMGKFVERKLRRQFDWRHQRLQRDLEIHNRCPCKLKVILSGASGFVGQEVQTLLRSGGHEVVQLLRKKAGDSIVWDPIHKQIQDISKLEGADAWIHLSGDNIAEGRWTVEKRKKILDSRVETTAFVAEIANRLEQKPKAVISASAIGYYGSEGNFDENSKAGKDFLAQVCEKWEAALDGLDPSIRRVHPRIGVVVGAKGGMLHKLLPVFKLGFGGPIGFGKRMLSWIEVEDLSRILYQACFDEQFQGSFNAVSPNAVSNGEFVKALAQRVKKPAFFSAPPFLFKLVFGEMAQATLLSSATIRPKSLLEWGFKYQKGDLEAALENQVQ